MKSKFLSFLSEDQPLHTCSSKECNGCDVSGELVCHFNNKQAVTFLFTSYPPIILGIVGVALYNALFLIPWLLIIIAFFGFVEIRVMCSHCPHYAEPELSKLQCWANYGAPKLWKYRPGPMSIMEKVVFFIGMGLFTLYPLPILYLKGGILGWSLLAGYVISMVLTFTLLKGKYCKACINFACPFNRVKEDVRERFFNRNPVVKEAWKKRV